MTADGRRLVRLGEYYAGRRGGLGVLGYTYDNPESDVKGGFVLRSGG